VGRFGDIEVSTDGTPPARGGDAARVLTIDLEELTWALSPREQAREKIGRIRAALTEIEYLCSGTLHKRTKVCGRPTCRCAKDAPARHGPYYEWGHLVGGKLVHRVLTPEQAKLLQQAIDNQRRAKKLLRAWEEQTERLIGLQAPRQPCPSRAPVSYAQMPSATCGKQGWKRRFDAIYPWIYPRKVATGGLCSVDCRGTLRRIALQSALGVRRRFIPRTGC
jgi:hypothetical protein